MKRIGFIILTVFFLQLTSPNILFARYPEQTKQKQKPKKKASKIKKDGSWDKRFKENKHKNDKVAKPKKKDGTADMRYKVNKQK